MVRIVPLSGPIRHIARYKEMLEVLIGVGLADVVNELGLETLAARALNLIRRVPPPELTQMDRPQRLRRAMELLGPTYIKLGQVLSTRPDLIPPAWADEFAKLQVDAPKIPFEQVELALAAEFPGQVSELFSQITTTPMAAASMAQVHEAVLADGTSVVIKVRRPGIDRLTQTDLEILSALAHFLEKHFTNLGYDPVEVVEEFKRELAKEIDFTSEGQATDRLREMFNDDVEVIVPRVFWQATGKTVLTLERINGTILSSLDPSTMTPEDRRRLVTAGTRAVLRQTLEAGFFHADPHPGNLFALEGGRIAFIDCGMTGQLDRRTRENLADLVHGVVVGDVEKVVRVVGELGDVDPKTLTDRLFIADVRDFMNQFGNIPIEQLDLGKLLREFFGKLRAHNLRCPASLVLLIKALSTIEGVAARIDPEFSLMEVARPFVEKLVRERFGPRAVRRRLQQAVAEYAQLVERLPNDIKQVIQSVNRDRLTINLEHHRLDKLTETLEHASRNIAFALVVAALFVGSSILVLANRGGSVWGLSLLGIVGFVLAGVLAGLRFIGNRFF